MGWKGSQSRGRKQDFFFEEKSKACDYLVRTGERGQLWQQGNESKQQQASRNTLQGRFLPLSHLCPSKLGNPEVECLCFTCWDTEMIQIIAVSNEEQALESEGKTN